MQALFTLTPAESKRLIGKGVAALPEIKNAMRKGYLLVGRGSTNAYILEELLGEKIRKEGYLAGQVIRGVLCVLGPEERTQPVTFHKGKPLPVEPGTVLDKLSPGDILLKGANALDSGGNVGVVMASPTGGTMGQFLMAMKARGLEIIYPVGLEKMVPSVELAAQYGGSMTLGKTVGARVGMACVSDGIVFTELDAIESLFDLEAVHFASGGWGGAEGCVTIAIEGPDAEVGKCLRFIERNIKGEPPLPGLKSPCKTCGIPCSFKGKDLKELPGYLK
ncbi:MAG: hypothetical protein A4E68_01797 [Syntrophaceae bacterium PtaB.Bin095]|jgi:hypothetical protein|nr:MAG: hypothetical protein A4E68_01797 [Syntrophaceae bacterium PtaB.Bin095]